MDYRRFFVWLSLLLLVFSSLLLISCGTKLYSTERVWRYDNPPQWKRRAPIKVMAAGDVLSVKESLDYWNRSVGCKLFEQIEHGEPDVVVLQGGNSGYAGSTDLVIVQDRPVSVIKIFNRGSDNIITAYLVLTHELGHALGLGHDTYLQRSIMYPYVIFDFMSDDWERPLPQITTADRNGVREKYCQ